VFGLAWNPESMFWMQNMEITQSSFSLDLDYESTFDLIHAKPNMHKAHKEV